MNGHSFKNIAALEQAAGDCLEAESFAYLQGGSDDQRTLRASTARFADYKIRARRLVNVSEVRTGVTVLGQAMRTPILLAPVGFQGLFHPEAERATARAAARRGGVLIVSSASTHPVGEIAAESRRAGGAPVWFQLYPTPDRQVTRLLLRKAEEAGCPVVVLTVDVPVLGNRESDDNLLARLVESGRVPMGNYGDLLKNLTINDPSMSWEMLGWLRENCDMKIVVKGIVTGEDAALCAEHGADGLIVSNHGGRQEESDRSTIEVLAEVVAASGEVPVLLDGGIRRGTDIFKALALGARAVCVGRAFCWGLAAAGQAGVECALEILEEELVRCMQLAGTPTIESIGPSFITGDKK